VNEPAQRIAHHLLLPKANNESWSTFCTASCSFPSCEIPACMHVHRRRELISGAPFRTTCNTAPPLADFGQRSEIRLLSKLRVVMSHRQSYHHIYVTGFLPDYHYRSRHLHSTWPLPFNRTTFPRRHSDASSPVQSTCTWQCIEFPAESLMPDLPVYRISSPRAAPKMPTQQH
jgi:hypothetical protein